MTLSAAPAEQVNRQIRRATPDAELFPDGNVHQGSFHEQVRAAIKAQVFNIYNWRL